MDNNIVNSLVEVYKRKGISMQELLNDPVFTSLPIQKQLDAVQAYAGVLHVGSRAPQARPLIARSAGLGAISGAFAGLPIMFMNMKPNSHIHPAGAKLGQILGISAVGATIGGIAGYLDHLKNKKNFDNNNRYLAKIKDSRNLTDSVEFLSNKRKEKPAGPPPISGTDLMRQTLEKGAPHYIQHVMKNLKEDKAV